MEDKPAAQATIDELRMQASTQEDHAYLDDEQARLEKERQAILGQAPIKAAKLVELPDGSIATEDEVAESRKRGEEPSGPYDGRRRA